MDNSVLALVLRGQGLFVGGSHDLPAGTHQMATENPPTSGAGHFSVF